MLLKYIYDNIGRSNPFCYEKALFDDTEADYENPIPFVWGAIILPFMVSVFVLFGLTFSYMIADGIKSLWAMSVIGRLSNAYFIVLISYELLFFSLFLIVPMLCYLFAIVKGVFQYAKARKNIAKVNQMYPSDLNCIVPTAIFGAFAKNVHENMIDINPFVLQENPYKLFDHLVEVLDDESDYVKYKLTGAKLLKGYENYSKEFLTNHGIRYYAHSSYSYSIKKKDFLNLYVSTGDFSNKFELTEQ